MKHSSEQRTVYKGLLGNDHDVTCAALTFGGSLDTIVIAQRNMDDAALVRCHRAQLNAAVLAGCTVRSRTGDRFELLPLPAFVSFDIDHDGVAETHFPYGDG